MKYLHKTTYKIQGKNLFATINCTCGNFMYLQGLNEKSFFEDLNKFPRYINCSQCNKQTPYRFVENSGVYYWMQLPDDFYAYIGNSNVQYIIQNGIDESKSTSDKVKSILWQFTKDEIGYEQVDKLLSILSDDTIELLLGLNKELYVYK